MSERVRGDAEDGERLDRAVASLLDISRTSAGELIDAGHVSIDGQTVTQRSRRLRAGQVLEAERAAPPGPEEPSGEPVVDVPIRYRDEHLVVVAKPAGLVVHPAPGHRGTTLVESLAALRPQGGDPERPGIVHRLDRDTSGLLVVALTAQAHRSLTEMMKERAVSREYLALVDGVIQQDSLTIDGPVGRDPRQRTRMAVVAEGRDAVTDIEVMERLGNVSFVQAILRTGRTHQIRVHLSAIDHPVCGDATYRADQRIARSLGLQRHFLHARRLSFRHPVTSRLVSVEEPLPQDLQPILDRARERAKPQEPGENLPPHRQPGSPHLETD